MKHEFDEEKHIYKIDGKTVPSVTTIINQLLPMKFSANDWYLQRGSAVHQCCAYIAAGVEFDFDERISGQVKAIRRFFKEVKPEVIDFESHVFNDRYRYGGTFDLYAIIGGYKCIIDFKSTIEIEKIALQVSGYSIAYGGNVRLGIGVKLGENGKYSMTEPIVLKQYEREFLALRTTYAIRERMGLNKKPEVL